MKYRNMLAEQLYIRDILNGNVIITDYVKHTFTVLQKKALEHGWYIVYNKAGDIKHSNKYPQKALDQLASYDEFIKNIFTEV